MPSEARVRHAGVAQVDFFMLDQLLNRFDEAIVPLSPFSIDAYSMIVWISNCGKAVLVNCEL